jgi:RimJ/RimL family protein N-acetyltransferase
MSKEFNIRALNGRDWQAFRDIRLEALRDYPGNFGAQYADELRLEKQQWIDRIEDPMGKIFGLFHGTHLIGTNGVCTYRDDPTGKTALMIMWYMRSGYQGRGLFSDLVKAGIDWAEAQPCFDCIRVHHRDGNEASRKSNQKHGFNYIEQEPWTWPDGKTVDLVMYERRFER